MCIRDRYAQLRSENARLISLLEKHGIAHSVEPPLPAPPATPPRASSNFSTEQKIACLLYTSDAADERSSVDLGGRRIIKKTKKTKKQKQQKKNKK